MEYKRHKANGKKKAEGPGAIGTAVFVILTIALIAAIVVLSPIGKYLNERVVSPLLSCANDEIRDDRIVSALTQQESKTPEPTVKPMKDTEKTVLTINETQFYILQMGAFTDQETATRRSEELRRLGAGGTIRKEGNVFRVFAAAYLDEDSLMKVQSQVHADGFEATPYITEKYSVKLTLEGKKQDIETVKESTEMIGEIPVRLSKLCLQYDKNELSTTDILMELNGLDTNCKNMIEKIEALSNPTIKPLKVLIEKYEEYISTFSSLHDTIDTEAMSGMLKDLQLKCIIDYILFFEQR